MQQKYTPPRAYPAVKLPGSHKEFNEAEEAAMTCRKVTIIPLAGNQPFLMAGWW